MNKPKQLPFIILAIGIIALWAGSPFVLRHLIPDYGDRALFGDQFGAVSALFNALAFLGLIFTIYQQHIELSLQRQELADTRIELRKAAEAQHQSQSALKEQVLAQRDAAAIAAMDTLIRINRDIVSADIDDDVARRMPHFKQAQQKITRFARALEQRLENTI